MQDGHAELSPNTKARCPAETFRSRQIVRATGIYRAIHSCRAGNLEVLLFKGSFFARCPQCGDMQYEVIRKAPLGTDDPDLR